MNLNEININRIIREGIERLIRESSSVSDDTLAANRYILGQFLRGNYNFQYAFNEVGEIEIEGNVIEVNNPNINLDGAFDVANKKIKFPIPFYNGEICVLPLKKTIQHEIEHAYQILLKKDNGDFKNRYNEIYNKAIDIFNDENSNYYDKELARYFYCCSNMEQDSFVNELYVELKGKSPMIISQEVDIIKDSNAFKAYRTIVDVRNDMQDPQGNGSYRQAFDKYNSGFKYKWLIQLGYNAEERIKSKIANVVRRARKEIRGNVVSPHINLDAIFD